MRLFILIAIIIFLVSCKSKPPQYDIKMSHAEIVKILVEMYSMNAAVAINDVTYRDSTHRIYFDQFGKFSGKNQDEAKRVFDQLLQHPDTLIMLQNIALDTLRKISDTRGRPFQNIPMMNPTSSPAKDSIK
jgi:hypothetical protein